MSSVVPKQKYFEIVSLWNMIHFTVYLQNRKNNFFALRNWKYRYLCVRKLSKKIQYSASEYLDLFTSHLPAHPLDFVFFLYF